MRCRQGGGVEEAGEEAGEEEALTREGRRGDVGKEEAASDGKEETARRL